MEIIGTDVNAHKKRLRKETSEDMEAECCSIRSMDHSSVQPEGSRIAGSVVSGAVIAIKYG